MFLSLILRFPESPADPPSPPSSQYLTSLTDPLNSLALSVYLIAPPLVTNPRAAIPHHPVPPHALRVPVHCIKMQYQIPSHSDQIKVSFPIEHVLLLTFNRPQSLNAMTPTMTADIGRVLDWFENDASLWCAYLLTQNAGTLLTFCQGCDRDR